MDQMRPHSGPPGSIRNQVPQLSCEACRHRKVKCDKLDPCTNCVTLGVVCVPVHRLRLPRGRHARGLATRDENLKKRIRRLEALVTEGPQAIGSPTGSGFAEQTNASSAPEAEPVDSPVKRVVLLQHPDQFWADLAAEIHGLRDLIESTTEDASEETPEQEIQAPSPLHYGIRFLGLSGPSDGVRDPQFVDYPVLSNGWLASQLCQVYLQQVDPVIKILHRPSISKLIIQEECYMEYPEKHSSVKAIRAAVMYAAASSLTESQCYLGFQVHKADLVADCRKACESTMEGSGLLVTRDITVLQAFVLYLVARRSEERSRAVWTLLALAVRIAKALALNVNQDKETFFYRQMRRRLWLTICLMDIQGSFSLASQPLIPLEEALSASHLPSHINDSDFDIATENDIPDKEGLTDTTFAIITYKLQLMGRLTNFGHRTPQGCNCDTNLLPDTQLRQKHVGQFEEESLRLLRFCDPESSTYAWFVFHSAQCFVSGARACVLRPLQRQQEGGESPPMRKQGDAKLLQLASQNLEKAVLMHTAPRGEGFRWYVTVQWHVLAIALAECYITSDLNLVRRVWPVVEMSYRLHESIIAKLKGGTLRGPLGRLFERTKERIVPILSGGVKENLNASTAESLETNSTAPSSAFDSSRSEDLGSSIFTTSCPARQNWELLEGSPLQQAVFIPESSVDSQTLLSAASASVSSGAANSNYVEPCWVWEEFVSDLSLDHFSSLDTSFSGSRMNAP